MSDYNKCDCVIKKNGKDIITTQTISKINILSPNCSEQKSHKKISLKKKVLIDDLMIEGNIKTEKDKLAQNKSIMRILSDQDKFFDVKFITISGITEKLYKSYGTLSSHTQIKWNESLINYISRYISMQPKLQEGLIKQLSDVIIFLRNEKKHIKSANINVKTPKEVRDYLAMYSAQGISYRNRIYARIKLDKYPVSDVILSNTRLRDYTTLDNYIDITNKKWIINEKKHIEVQLTDEFIKDIENNRYIWLANNTNNDKISSTVINNGINRWFASASSSTSTSTST